MKKKVISVLLALTMAASLTACGGSAGGDSAGTDAAPADDGAAAEEAAPTEDAAGEEAAVTEGASADDNTLTVWTWDPNFNVYAINKAAEIYAQDHEGFKVEVDREGNPDRAAMTLMESLLRFRSSQACRIRTWLIYLTGDIFIYSEKTRRKCVSLIWHILANSLILNGWLGSLLIRTRAGEMTILLFTLCR